MRTTILAIALVLCYNYRLPFIYSLPAAPTAPPSGIQLDVSYNQVTVSFSAPPAGSQGGVLTEYTICFLRDSEDTCSVERTIPASSSSLSHVEYSLLHNTNYRVRVCAATAAGVGPCSFDISFATGMYWACYFSLLYCGII